MNFDELFDEVYPGLSYRELAEAIGVQPTSVGTLLARARHRFTEALGDEGNKR